MSIMKQIYDTFNDMYAYKIYSETKKDSHTNSLVNLDLILEKMSYIHTVLKIEVVNYMNNNTISYKSPNSETKLKLS